MIDQSNEGKTLNPEMVDAKIRRGLKELDRGEGIPEDLLDVHLAMLKAQRE
jgi:hypothetical protein